MGKTTCYVGYLFTNSRQYAKVYLKTGKTIEGKLMEIDLDERIIHLEMLSKEQGKRCPEIRTVNATHSLDSVLGMSRLTQEGYNQLKQDIDYIGLLDKYVNIKLNDYSELGRVYRITFKTIELRPFLNSRTDKNGEAKLYLERKRLTIITLPIKVVKPTDEENLKRIIKDRNKRH